MKKPKVILLPCLLAFAVAARGADTSAAKGQQPVDDLVRFANGDSLRGSVAGCDKEGLHWQSTFSKLPIVFKTANLIDVQFPRKMPANAQQSLYDVLLVNGDLLPGVIVSLNDKSLLLETWYAGKLSIPRAMIKSISTSGIIYKGPASVDEWEVGAADDNSSSSSQRGINFTTSSSIDSAWGYKNGALSCTGSGATIGRDLKLPSLARIEFDLTLGLNSQANIYLFSNEVKIPGICYLFQVNAMPCTVDLARYSPDTPNVRIGQQATLDASLQEIDAVKELEPAIGGPRSAFNRRHFDIRINKETKTIWLYVDGKFVQKYSHLDDLAEMGGSLIFAPGPQGTLMEISKIKVSKWDGGTDDTLSGDAANDDSMQSEKRAPLRGKLKGIVGGKVIFVSAGGSVEIPVAQLQWIRLSSAGTAPAKTSANDLRAQFLMHGWATMEIESWDSKHITATSPDFGTAEFNPGAFRRLQFNLQNPSPGGDGGAVEMADGDDD